MGTTIRPYRKGDALRAERLNELVDGLNSFRRGVSPGSRYQRPVRGTLTQVQMVLVDTVGPDYLICSIARGARKDSLIFVAKPPYLRRSMTAHAGLTFVVNTDSNFRTANDPNVEGEEGEEIQELVPPYAVGDEIAALNPVATGVLDTLDKEITWIDLNIWGRMWGVVPE